MPPKKCHSELKYPTKYLILLPVRKIRNNWGSMWDVPYCKKKEEYCVNNYIILHRMESYIRWVYIPVYNKRTSTYFQCYFMKNFDLNINIITLTCHKYHSKIAWMVSAAHYLQVQEAKPKIASYIKNYRCQSTFLFYCIHNFSTHTIFCNYQLMTVIE